MSADRPAVSRRRLLTGGALVAGGALAAGSAVAAATGGRPGAGPVPVAQYGTDVEPFHGERQAGVATIAQAYASFVAFTLRPGTDRARWRGCCVCSATTRPG